MKHEPVHTCIYCGADHYFLNEKKLATEHIVPYALGGIDVLPEASCKKCEVRTGPLEDSLIGTHGPYLSARLHGKYPSRGKSRRKGHGLVPINVHTEAGDRVVNVPEAACHHPIITATLPAPGVIAGRELGVFPEGDVKLEHRILVPSMLPPVSTSGRGFVLADFVRLLAKIGHAHAVAHFGFTGLDPVLAPLILQKRGFEIYHWVGGEPGHHHFEDVPYSIRHEILPLGGKDYVVVHIHLLARIGFPRHKVVAGTLKYS